MATTRRILLVSVCAALWAGATARAQVTELVTGFETDGQGSLLGFQPGSFEDLQIVLLQDPAEADVTTANVTPDVTPASGLPSTEESFVANFTGDGFFGDGGSDQFLDVRFEWANTNGTRWALIETLQSPKLGDPSLHLDGKVRLRVNIPDCSAFEFTDLQRTSPLGVALLIRETGNALPLGFQDTAAGALEFVGVSAVADANTANPVPVPTRFINITDANCTGEAADWITVEFDLSTEPVIGWTAQGGDGVLDATTNGDNVNRGVLAGIVLAVQQSDTTSEYVEFLVDNVEFDAPVTDPAVPPTIAAPVIAGANMVQVNNVISRATTVILEIDRSDLDNEDPFVADETIPVAAGLDPAGEDRFVVIPLGAALEVGDRIRARQAINADVSGYSTEILVNPPAAFSLTLGLDESGSLGTVANFEWVGASAVTGTAGTQGKPVFVQNAVWQKVEFSLIPGVEPVIDFAGGNGQLQPDGGNYSIDSLFFTIDSTDPQIGPYDVFLDHVYIIDASDNVVVIANAETANPFPLFRGQSTSINNTSTLSTLASYDGGSSNRLGWEFPNTTASNTVAPYRPQVTFADSAKAVGVWLLVENVKTNGLPLPAVDATIIGDAPVVTVSNIDSNATQVELLVNGVAAGTVDPMGATAVDIAPTVTLNVGDSVSAQYTGAGTNGLSDPAYARGVLTPPLVTVQSPLVAGQTSVTVNAVLNNVPKAAASLVTLYIDGSPVDSVDPAGSNSVIFSVAPALAAGEQVAATQTVNGVESSLSAPVGIGAGDRPCMVINEFVYDDSGATDDREFVELYNSSPDTIDLSNWQLRMSDTIAPPADTLPDVTIPAATSLASGDFYVIGSAAVPNVDLVVANNFWSNANAAIELLDTNGVVVDTVIYELNAGPVAVSPAEGGIWGNTTSIDGNEQSWSRWFDGYDTDVNGNDFGWMPISPGTSNVLPSAAPLADNFDAGVVGDPVPGFTPSFVALRYVDPTVVGGGNTYAIPASPQGGLAALCADTSGGGNVCVMDDEPRFNVSVSMEIYIDSNGTPFTAADFVEGDGWAIGLGTEGAFYNINVPFRSEDGANGNAGLFWRYYRYEGVDTNGIDDGTVGDHRLQLVNENDGGADGVILMDVPATALSTGWHTMSLTRSYENWAASFDAISSNGVVAGNGPGTLFIGFREYSAGYPARTRPPTIDNLVVSIPAAPPLGACCSECACLETTEAECVANGGGFNGVGSTCVDDDFNGIADICEALIPPAPVVDTPVCDGVTVVSISGLAPESSEVTVFEGGVNPIGTAATGGNATALVFVGTPLTAGQVITATQTAGIIESDPSAGVIVEVCAAFCQTVYADDFDTDSSAAWTVNATADAAATFNYDYSADGIPPSPHGDGSTLGVKFEANISTAAAHVVAASPNGVSMTGQYEVRFDFWINANGPFPGGGGGSTEFLGGGVGYDGVTAGLNGSSLIITGEGGSSRDWRMYKNTSEQFVASGQYAVDTNNSSGVDLSAAFPGQAPPLLQQSNFPQQTGTTANGSGGFAWHSMAINVDSALQIASFRVDDTIIGTLVCDGSVGPACTVTGAVDLIYADLFASVSDNAALSFGIVDNFRVLIAKPDSVIAGDWDNDGDVDLADYTAFEDCFAGPNAAPQPANDACAGACLETFDSDSDGDMDLIDFANFQVDFTG